MSAIGTTMQVQFLGTDYQLAQDSSNPLQYIHQETGLTVLLNQQPLNDSSAQELLVATVTRAAVGIITSRYECEETGAATSTFEASTPGIICKLDSDMQLTLTAETGGLSDTMEETGMGTQLFVGQHLQAKVLGESPFGDTLDIAIHTVA